MNLAAPSGPGTHMREMIHGFENRGHEVVRCIAGGETLSGENADIRFRKHGIRKFIPEVVWQTLKEIRWKRHDQRMEQWLRSVVEQEQPDLVYERACPMITAGVRVAAASGVPHFLEMNAPYPEEKRSMEGAGMFHRRASSAEQQQVKLATRVFVVSSALRDYLAKRVQGARPAIVTPNAVQPALAESGKGKGGVFRQRWKLQETHRVIGFVGSVFPYHGVDMLIDAFVELAAVYPDISLLIIGDGESLPALRQRAAHSVFRDRIVFTGNLPHGAVFEGIDAMDIAVMARSNWYGSPVKLFEYGYMGKAIIAPDTIPVRDVMEDGVDGLLVKNDLTALTEALRKVLEEPDLAGRMAAHFCSKVKSNYTWQHVADRVLSECP